MFTITVKIRSFAYMGHLLQLKVEIKDTSPAIWRRIVVEDSASFYQLHHIIQIAFGWENSHLYEFRIGNQVLANPQLVDEEEEEVRDDKAVTLYNIFGYEGDQANYIYDFGDHWQHLITYEERSELDNGPLCIAGGRSGPPEDCGGTFGYERLVKLSGKKGYVDIQNIFNQLERSRFYPELVELDKINFQLGKLEEYIEESIAS